MASKLLACICHPGEQEQRRIHREIEKELKKDKKSSGGSYKLLLLGTGGAGKSTFIKQMRIIHGNGYSNPEREYFKCIIFQNIFSTLQLLISSLRKRGVAFTNPDLEKYVSVLLAINADALMEVSSVQHHIALSLWKDPAVKSTFEQRAKLRIAISDAVPSFLDDLKRIFSNSYVPTLADILRVRVPSTGITEYPFSLDGVVFRLVDVGGQRSERRKWIHCFEDCTSIIFVTASSEYDEDIIDIDLQGREVTGNRMAESLALFQTLISYPWFEHSSIILFLNKNDLLQIKVQEKDFSTFFPSYKGPPNDFRQVREHILTMFTALNQDKQRHIYPHYTSATDTENIRVVFDAVMETVVTASLRQFNLI